MVKHLAPRLILALAATFLAAGQVLALDGPNCDRKAFGRFSQVDKMDTRARLLTSPAVAIGPVEITSNSKGVKRVTWGSWIDGYSGNDLLNVSAKEVEVDHVIPVCWAWSHGADGWTREKRRAFYNDTQYLVVVDRRHNRSKGKQTPLTYLPPKQQLACNYVERFLDGVRVYDLHLSVDEKSALLEVRNSSCAIVHPQ